MRHRSGYVVALLGILSAPALAQERSGPDQASVARTRVRVTMESHEQVTGTIVAMRPDTVVLRVFPDGGERALSRAKVARIERSAGTSRSRIRGATLGFLSGAVVGTGVGYAMANHSACSNNCFNGLDESVKAVGGGIAGALVGATVGVVVGNRQREQWREVVGDGVRVGIGPAPGKRVAMSLSLRR
jgi:hypothetical protein